MRVRANTLDFSILNPAGRAAQKYRNQIVTVLLADACPSAKLFHVKRSKFLELRVYLSAQLFQGSAHEASNLPFCDRCDGDGAVGCKLGSRGHGRLRCLRHVRVVRG